MKICFNVLKNDPRRTEEASLLPAVNLHGTILREVLMHLESLEEQVRLMAHTLPNALKLRAVEVIREDGLVVRVRAVLDDNTGTLARGETADVRETLLGHDHVEVVLCLVDVGGEGDDAGDTGGVSLGGPRGGGVHDAVAGVTEEVGGAAEAVEHAGAEDAGGVGVGVHVDFDGGVHADAAQTADDLGGVGDLLGAEEELVGVAVPVVKEALEAGGGEADGGGGGEVEVAAVEEVEEGVLQDFGPHLEVLEVGAALAQTADDCVGNVSNARLQGEEVLRHTAHVDLVLEEVDQVTGNGLRGGILGRVVGGAVRVVSFHNGNHLLRVNGDVGGTNAVFRTHDHVGLGVGGLLGHGDIMQTLERGTRGVNLDDHLVGHVDKLRRGTNGSTGNDTTILGDSRSLDDSHIDFVVWFVHSVEALVWLASRTIPPKTISIPRTTHINQIRRKQTQVLIKKVDLPSVQPLGNILSNLMRTPPLNHVQLSPSTLRLSTRRGTHEQSISHLSFEFVLLDVVCQSGRDFPGCC